MKKIVLLVSSILLTLVYSCSGDPVDSSENLNSDASISSIIVKSNDKEYAFDIQANDSIISQNLPVDFNLDNVELELIIDKNATAIPEPKSITDITKPISFIITAEDNTTREYNITFTRPLFTGNNITSFSVIYDDREYIAQIDESTKRITRRLPFFVDFFNLKTKVTYSAGATISPVPETIRNYVRPIGNPIEFEVTSESGDKKTYAVDFSKMFLDFNESCEIMNATKWFGGDDRIDDPDPTIEFEPRNVGTGQAIMLDHDLHATSFGVHFDSTFKQAETSQRYIGEITIQLHVRDKDGSIISSTTSKLMNDSFNGGWVDFDLKPLNLFLEQNTPYIFTWHLKDGESLGIVTGSNANNELETSICKHSGYTGTSNTKDNNNLDQWNTWYNHEWHFNFRLRGWK